MLGCALPSDRLDDLLALLVDRGDKFAVVTRMRGRSKGAHIATEMRTSGVIEVRDGLVARIVGHSDPEDAIAAVGPDNPQPP